MEISCARIEGRAIRVKVDGILVPLAIAASATGARSAARLGRTAINCGAIDRLAVTTGIARQGLHLTGARIGGAERVVATGGIAHRVATTIDRGVTGRRGATLIVTAEAGAIVPRDAMPIAIAARGVTVRRGVTIETVRGVTAHRVETAIAIAVALAATPLAAGALAKAAAIAPRAVRKITTAASGAIVPRVATTTAAVTVLAKNHAAAGSRRVLGPGAGRRAAEAATRRAKGGTSGPAKAEAGTSVRLVEGGTLVPARAEGASLPEGNRGAGRTLLARGTGLRLAESAAATTTIRVEAPE